MKRVVLVWPPVAASTGRHLWQELYCLFLQFQSHEAFPEKTLASALRNMKLSSMYPLIQEALIPSALVVVNQRSKTLGLLSLLDCHVEAFSEELDLHKQGRSLSLYQEDLEGEIGVTQVAPEETQVDFRPNFFLPIFVSFHFILCQKNKGSFLFKSYFGIGDGVGIPSLEDNNLEKKLEVSLPHSHMVPYFNVSTEMLWEAPSQAQPCTISPSISCLTPIAREVCCEGGGLGQHGVFLAQRYVGTRPVCQKGIEERGKIAMFPFPHRHPQEASDRVSGMLFQGFLWRG